MHASLPYITLLTPSDFNQIYSVYKVECMQAYPTSPYSHHLTEATKKIPPDLQSADPGGLLLLGTLQLPPQQRHLLLQAVNLVGVARLGLKLGPLQVVLNGLQVGSQHGLGLALALQAVQLRHQALLVRTQPVILGAQVVHLGFPGAGLLLLLKHILHKKNTQQPSVQNVVRAKSLVISRLVLAGTVKVCCIIIS